MSRPDRAVLPPSSHEPPTLEGWRAAFISHLTGQLQAGGWSGPTYHLGLMPHIWDHWTFTFEHPTQPRTLSFHLCSGDDRPTIHISDHTAQPGQPSAKRNARLLQPDTGAGSYHTPLVRSAACPVARLAVKKEHPCLIPKNPAP